MKIAIDLLWLRPGKVGGTESYVRNLLDGFVKLDDAFQFVLLVSKDNKQTFRHYLEDNRISIITANVSTANIGKRIIWQNINQNRLLRKHNIRYCFCPVYCRPFTNGGIQYINTIHDIQAHHFPQYHPFYEVWYSKLCWWTDKNFSKKIIAISNYVKQDLIEIYKIKESKIEVIYNPIMVVPDNFVRIEELERKFGINRNNYYYTLAQLIPHKNLTTLIMVMVQIKQRKLNLPNKLVVSGIPGNASDQIRKLIKESDLEKEVILTGYIENSERNTLYKYCKVFLFPSIFEGFGMPPVEAMSMGIPVITTKCTSIPEVTQQKANYVEDPFSVEEWLMKMKDYKNESNQLVLDQFDIQYIARKYLKVLYNTFQKE